MATVGYYGPNVVTTTNVPGVPSSVSQGPPGSGPGSMGNVNVNPADDWISAPQTAEVYYGPGGQGTTNVNITDPSGGGYDAAAAQAAAAQAAAAQDDTTVIDKVKSTVSNLYKNFLQGKPIRQLTRDERILLMQGLGRYDPIKGFQPGGASAYGALLNAIFGKEQKYRMDDEGNYIYDEDLPDEYEDKRMFTKEGIVDFMRSIDPESNILGSIQKDMPGIYYDVMGMPGTMGGLEDLAGMAATDTTGMDRDSKEYRDAAKLNQQIFDARAELDRQQAYGGQGAGGGGAGIADLGPLQQLAAEVAPEEEVAAATVPATTTTAAAATAPMPFDYSQWPQFTSAYPGYNQYPGPNYVDQGLGQWPQFNYWNQIASAYPGMSQYG